MVQERARISRSELREDGADRLNNMILEGPSFALISAVSELLCRIARARGLGNMFENEEKRQAIHIRKRKSQKAVVCRNRQRLGIVVLPGFPGLG